jgi:flagellar biosynthesis chaperone FliJ
VIPPGFNLDPEGEEEDKGGEKTEEENEGFSEEELEKIVDSAPNESYRNNVVKMRELIGKKSEQVANLQKQIETLQSSGGENPEAVTKLKEELDSVYDRLGRYDLAQTPGFKEKYIKPIEGALDQVANIVGTIVEDKDSVVEIVRTAAMMNPVERMDYLNQYVPEAAKVVIAAHFKDVDTFAYQRDQALKNHQDELKRMEEDQLVDQTNRVQEYKNAVKSKVMDEIVSKDGFKIFAKKPGNAEYNAYVDTLLQATNEVFENNDPEVQAKAMLLGTAAPVYRGMYEATLEKLREVQSELASVRGVLPRRGGSSGGKRSGKAPSL